MNNRSDMNRMVSMMGKVKNGPYMMGNEPTKKERRATKNSTYREPVDPKRTAIKGTSQDYSEFKGVTDANLKTLQSENRNHVDKYNIGKLNNFGETYPLTQTFAEFKKYELERMNKQSRGVAPDKMYNHSTGKKQPTGRELYDDREAKRVAKTKKIAKSITKQ